MGSKSLSPTSLDPQINCLKAATPKLTRYPQHPNWYRTCTKGSLSRAFGLEPEGPAALGSGWQEPLLVTRVPTRLSRKGTLATMEQLLILGGCAQSPAQEPGQF